MRRHQAGQALVFGLIFLAVVISALLILYNQGQLTRHRVQIENAADAAAYSQAKLAARNQNFIAYTNRAMVANEVSIGQMVAMLSWAKHYKDIPRWTNSFPLYQFPVAPPAPITFNQVLNAAFLPFTVLGTALEVPAKVMTKVWPTPVSYFNGALGIFQKLFALGTIQAQIEATHDVVKGHEAQGEEGQLYMPVVGWYFLTQNAVLTYFGDTFSIDNLVGKIGSAGSSEGGEGAGSGGPGGGAGGGSGGDEEEPEPIFSAEELATDFLGFAIGDGPQTMILDNTPAKARGGAKQDEAESPDGVADAYKRFAAIVNDNRDGFTMDRHWDFGVGAGTGFSLALDFGIIRLDIDLDLGFWTGVKNDGGTTYRFNPIIGDATNSYGWTSMDALSMGVEFNIGLNVRLTICLPIVGCSSHNLIDIDFTLPLGFPLGAATHQLTSSATNVMRALPQWGFPGMSLLSTPGGKMYGGLLSDVGSSENRGVFDLFHTAVLGWGQVLPPAGVYGTTPTEYDTAYGGPPGFFSLGEGFRDSGRSYEFTVAVAKRLSDVQTSDGDTLGITGNSAMPPHTRFDVKTRSAAEGNPYRQLIWQNSRPMMSVSSAETYFANPWRDERASLFGPFWDARLREPSRVTLMIATGDIPWEELIPGLGSSAKFIVGWFLDKFAEKVVDISVGHVMSLLKPPLDSALEGPVGDAVGAVVEAGTDAAKQQLDNFIPD